jgi:hypothetical protein
MIITFVGVHGPLPLTKLNISNLQGGRNGTSPIANVQVLRKGSYNLLYEPIPY